MRNLCNTCFINSTLQCLRATPGLLQHLAPELLADPSRLPPDLIEPLSAGPPAMLLSEEGVPTSPQSATAHEEPDTADTADTPEDASACPAPSPETAQATDPEVMPKAGELAAAEDATLPKPAQDLAAAAVHEPTAAGAAEAGDPPPPSAGDAVAATETLATTASGDPAEPSTPQVVEAPAAGSPAVEAAEAPACDAADRGSGTSATAGADGGPPAGCDGGGLDHGPTAPDGSSVAVADVAGHGEGETARSTEGADEAATPKKPQAQEASKEDIALDLVQVMVQLAVGSGSDPVAPRQLYRDMANNDMVRCLRALACAAWRHIPVGQIFPALVCLGGSMWPARCRCCGARAVGAVQQRRPARLPRAAAVRDERAARGARPCGAETAVRGARGRAGRSAGSQGGAPVAAAPRARGVAAVRSLPGPARVAGDLQQVQLHILHLRALHGPLSVPLQGGCAVPALSSCPLPLTCLMRVSVRCDAVIEVDVVARPMRRAHTTCRLLAVDPPSASLALHHREIHGRGTSVTGQAWRHAGKMTFFRGKTIDKLDDCFRAYTEEEKLEGNEAYFCPACRGRHSATKALRIHRFPRCLVLHIKRFKGLNRTHYKLSSNVSFPLHGLNLAPFSTAAAAGKAASHSGRGAPGLYDLYAVSNHTGSLDSGHYTAYVKVADPENEGDQKWLLLADDKVSDVRLHCSACPWHGCPSCVPLAVLPHWHVPVASSRCGHGLQGVVCLSIPLPSTACCPVPLQVMSRCPAWCGDIVSGCAGTGRVNSVCRSVHAVLCATHGDNVVRG